MIVHIFNNQRKFSLGFFRFLHDRGFDLSDTAVYHYGKPGNDFDACGVRPRFLRSWFWPFGHLRMYRDLKKADRIVIHSLASPFLIAMLRWNRSLCGKVWWVIWGKDLYLYHLSEKKPLPLKMYEAFRKPVMRDIAHIVATMREDYDLAREWYGAKADFTPCYELYPYADDYGDGAPARCAEGKLTLLLGNSASRTNEHLDAIDLLATKTENIRKVFCPLSYGGSRRYAERVRNHGREALGDLFEPLMDYLPFEEYKKIWESTDVGVFNQKRQEALGNIFSLIMKKRTVYLRPGMPMSRFFARLGVVTPALDREGAIRELPADVREKNAATLLEYIHPDRSAKTWKQILEGGGTTA